MEITFTQQIHRSMVIGHIKKRELADFLDITVKEMNKLISNGEFFGEHEDRLLEWMENNHSLSRVTESDPYEVEEITA